MTSKTATTTFTDEQSAKIIAAAAAGTLRANEAFDVNGWRKAPAQCPICCDLIKGEPHTIVMAILTAWNKNYQMQSSRRADEALARTP